nr:uncharacterized protein LOC125418858 [Ziziphus jujuba var. spinosa]
MDGIDYEQWRTNLFIILEYDTIIHCYILAKVVNHLQKQIFNLKDGLEMIKILDRMFAKSCSTIRQAAISALMYSHMTEESILEHCLIMIRHFSCAKVMRGKLDEDVQIDMILASLSDSFNQFKLNYDMNNLKLSPIDIMHQLENAKKTLMKLANA